MQTITNNFHRTEYTTSKTDDQINAIELRMYNGTATDTDKAWVRKVSKALCGTTRPDCGDFIGRLCL